MAKVTCITISLWAGYSYFMLLILTTMNTISPTIYDAAAMDGASKSQTFRKLILPLLVKRTTPFIVLAFTQNMNNFTTVFFLTEGNPALANTTTTSAGGSDLLITWIYNLTFNLMKFNYASVITVVLFIVLIPIAVWQFKKTNMYREAR
jgi:arabinogalactan oligomer/maltooligosaccharide transport system permease protein